MNYNPYNNYEENFETATRRYVVSKIIEELAENHRKPKPEDSDKQGGPKK